jgi:VWFA-related protein
MIVVRLVLLGGLLIATVPAAFATGEAGGGRGVQQAPVFSSRAEAVRIDVFVRQDGRPVHGLQAADFEVLDNGVRQEIEVLGLERAPLDVVLALDMSGSVQDARLEQLRAAGARLLASLAEDDAAALVVFSDLVSLRSEFTADKDRLLAALQAPVDGVDTALRDAVHAAMLVGSAVADRPLVIVFSDGVDTASVLTPSLVLENAKQIGPVVYAVAPAQPGRDRFLDDLVRLTGGRRLDVASLDRVGEAFDEIFREARARYVVTYTPRGVETQGWHELSIRLRGRRGEVRARPGYFAAR